MAFRPASFDFGPLNAARTASASAATVAGSERRSYALIPDSPSASSYGSFSSARGDAGSAVSVLLRTPTPVATPVIQPGPALNDWSAKCYLLCLLGTCCVLSVLAGIITALIFGLAALRSGFTQGFYFNNLPDDGTEFDSSGITPMSNATITYAGFTPSDYPFSNGNLAATLTVKDSVLTTCYSENINGANSSVAIVSGRPFYSRAYPNLVGLTDLTPIILGPLAPFRLSCTGASTSLLLELLLNINVCNPEPYVPPQAKRKRALRGAVETPALGMECAGTTAYSTVKNVALAFNATASVPAILDFDASS